MCFPNILLKNKWISEFHKTNPQELKCWSAFYVNYFLRYYLMMQNQPVVKRVNGTHEWAHRPYQPLSAPYHCCLYKHNPSGHALALTLACYALYDRAPPEVHPLKMFEILGHPHFKQLHGHKIPMNATNSPDRLNLDIFSLSLSYHSFVSVHDIQQKRLWIKLVFTLLLIPADSTVLPMRCFSLCARVMVVPPFDHPWHYQEVTWITWSPLWCSTHLPNSEIFNARNNALFIATVHVVKDTVAKVLGKQWVTICISARVVICAGARGCQANQWCQPGSEKWHGLGQNMWLSFLPTDF